MRWPQRRDAGALTLSYVIVFPAVLFALLFIVQAAMYYMAHNLALAAARQGADVAREFGSSDGLGAAAATNLINQNGSGMLAHVNAPSVTRNATTVTVTVSGSAWSLLPGLPIGVSETVQEPIERFVP